MTEQSLALHTLYRTHAPLVRRVLARLVPHSELDDAVQEVFLRLHRFQGSFREESKVSSWVYRVTINCAHDLYRRQRWRRWLHLDIDSTEIAAESSQDSHEALQKALKSLSFAEQTVVSLFYWEDASLEEISQHLEIPLGTVKSRLASARKKLKNLLLENDL